MIKIIILLIVIFIRVYSRNMWIRFVYEIIFLLFIPLRLKPDIALLISNRIMPISH